MPQTDPNELKVGDRAELTIPLRVAGVVSRRWSIKHADDTETHYLAVVDPGHGERVFRVGGIIRANVLEHNAEIPGPHKRRG